MGSVLPASGAGSVKLDVVGKGAQQPDVHTRPMEAVRTVEVAKLVAVVKCLQADGANRALFPARRLITGLGI